MATDEKPDPTMQWQPSSTYPTCLSRRRYVEEDLESVNLDIRHKGDLNEVDTYRLTNQIDDQTPLAQSCAS